MSLFPLTPERLYSGRVIASFPVSVIGDAGIRVSKANGVWTIDQDWSGLEETDDLTNKVMIAYDTDTEVFVRVPADDLGGGDVTADSTTTFTNKTLNLSGNTLAGTTAQFNTALSDGDFATLAGSETLTNKTITAPVLSGTVTGTYTLGGTPTFPSSVVTLTGSQTLTNKTLTSPAINSPTGIVKGDVGLGNVDNTSNATERAASATLTNKTIALGSNTVSGSISDFNTALTGADFATLAGSEILTNKSIDAAQLTGTVASARMSGAYTGITSIGTQSQAIVISASNPYFQLTDTDTGADCFVGGNNSTGSFELFADYFGEAANSAHNWFIDDASTVRMQLTTTSLNPGVSDSKSLGTSSVQWSDLFLASGADINIANGNWLASHTSGILTVGTGDLRVTSAGTNSASVVTVGGSQTLTGKTLTAPRIANAGFIADANGNEQLVLNTTASAINHFGITNAATGGPILEALGDDTNINFRLRAKGTGQFHLNGTSTTQAILRFFEDTDNGSNNIGIAPPASIGSDRTHTIPDVADDTFAMLAASQSLTNKTLNSATNTISLTGNTLSGVLPTANFPVWTTWTSTISASSGTITSASASARYVQIGKLVFISIVITVSNVGSGSGRLQFTLPSAMVQFSMFNGNRQNTGEAIQAFNTSGSTLQVLRYDGTGAIGNDVFSLSGFYEVS